MFLHLGYTGGYSYGPSASPRRFFSPPKPPSSYEGTLLESDPLWKHLNNLPEEGGTAEHFEAAFPNDAVMLAGRHCQHPIVVKKMLLAQHSPVLLELFNNGPDDVAASELQPEAKEFVKGLPVFVVSLGKEHEEVAPELAGYDWVKPDDYPTLAPAALAVFYIFCCTGELGWDAGARRKPPLFRLLRLGTLLKAVRFVEALDVALGSSVAEDDDPGLRTQAATYAVKYRLPHTMAAVIASLLPEVKMAEHEHAGRVEVVEDPGLEKIYDMLDPHCRKLAFSMMCNGPELRSRYAEAVKVMAAKALVPALAIPEWAGVADWKPKPAAAAVAAAPAAAAAAAAAEAPHASGTEGAGGGTGVAAGVGGIGGGGAGGGGIGGGGAGGAGGAAGAEQLAGVESQHAHLQLASKSVKELQQIARASGLPVSGNKSALCERILHHLEKQQGQQQG